MGGHGGLNILPQKKWNVYNFDNREKVKRDEEAAAKDEQLKRDQSRKRHSELRLNQLRASSSSSVAPPVSSASDPPEPESTSKLNHINLFDGIRIFDPVADGDNNNNNNKKMKFDDNNNSNNKKKKKKEGEEVRVVLPEDEVYRLGYGVAGKGVKMPWYMSRPIDERKSKKNDSSDDENTKHVTKSSGKKTLEQLREERLMREKKEKERERALITEKRKRDGSGYRDRRSSRW